MAPKLPRNPVKTRSSMAPTQSLFGWMISDSTVDQVLAAMHTPPQLSNRDREHIVALLQELFLFVHSELQLSPSNTRTKLNKTLGGLLRDVTSLRRRIADEESSEFIKILSFAALDLYDQSKSSTRASEIARYVAPTDILDRTEQSLADLDKLLSHLRDMIKQFDRLGPGEYFEWIGNAGSKRKMHIRGELLPHFRKRGGIGPDTIAVRLIAQIYEYTFDKRFNINSIEDTPRYQRERSNVDTGGPKPNLARYSGSAVDFSCAVIEALHLQSIFAAYAQNRTTSGKEQTISKASLINRIGDIWRNDTRRKNARTTRPQTAR